MGLGAALAGGIVMMMIAIVMGMAIPAILGANTSMSSAVSERQQLDDALSKSSVTITSLRAPALSSTATFTLNNTGSTKLWNYQKFIVIVTYDAQVAPLVSVKKTEELTYQGITNTTSPGYWSISGFNNDYVDPQIINPNESANFTCRLDDPLFPTGTMTAVVSTDAGASTSRSGAIS
ncbi:MAG: hypothetical protein ABI361_07495 [Nitrososphaera sp.]|jgi:type II secretory pathway pseudopilin PulG